MSRFLTTILPVLTLILGFVGSLVIEAARDKRATNESASEAVTIFSAIHCSLFRTQWPDEVRMTARIVFGLMKVDASGGDPNSFLQQLGESAIDAKARTLKL